MRKKITAKMVDNLTPPPQRTEIRDTVLKGFGFRYWKSKSDAQRVEGSWFITYRRRDNGKLARHTIGPLGRYRLVAARDKARDLFIKIDNGEPLRNADLPADTFGAVADVFINRYAKRHHKDWEKTARRIERELAGWRHRKITEITRADVLRALDRLLDQGKDYAANRLFEVVRKLFTWAVERGYIETSPVSGIRAPGKERKRDRVLTDDEIQNLWPALEGVGYPFGPLFQFLLVTGQRLGEVTSATWTEFDLDRKVWTIPSERYKSDRTHQVPLSDLALDILDSLPRIEGTNYLFSSGRTTRPVSGYSKAKERIDKQIDIAPWRLHDLRRTVRTGLGRLGVPPHVAELVIGHTQKGLHAVYDRYTYQAERADALQRWASFLRGVIAGEGGEFLPLVCVK